MILYVIRVDLLFIHRPDFLDRADLLHLAHDLLLSQEVEVPDNEGLECFDIFVVSRLLAL